MSARAAIRQADLNRALKVAAKNGFRVVVRGSEIEFLPIEQKATQPLTALEAWEAEHGDRAA